ncbi:exonuclease [Microcoleus sp. FACHB-53]|nr:exonuclease [Microcoleus sp. FACHB-53]
MHPQQNFIVIDTEGKNELREIAIINSQGKIVYEAFAKEHPDNYDKKFNLKPLREIIVDFLKVSQSKLVIFHNAKHDIQVLKKSFRKVELEWQIIKSQCSCELAKSYFHDLPSYSLEYLSKCLNLKVNKKYFNPHLAHTARYDAEFTYQLYLKIMSQTTPNTILDNLKDKPNPFGSIKVATPFQEHVDYKKLYQIEFESLKNIINDIKHDKNHQSQGVVVIGEPGSGKTHLMMRLAKELLKINRLLFIRQPNNADSVLYHTYSRILESFVEEVPGTNLTQLEHLLANSFVKLISSTTTMVLTKKDQDILLSGKNNKLDLYKNLGAEGTDRKRTYWDHIEKRANEWWINQYGMAGYSAQIIKGIVKFCGYSDPRRKELVTRWLSANELSQEELKSIDLNNWNEEMSKEEFSLQAISVFSKLSLLDEPLIIVFDQLESLGYDHKRKLLISFGEAVKEIFTHVPNSLIILNLFPERWEQFQEIFDGSIVDLVSQHEIQLQKPSHEKLKEILKLKAQNVGVNFDTLFSSAELGDILNQKSIRAVLKRAANYYKYKINGIPLPTSSASIKPKNPNNKVQHNLEIIEDIEDSFTQLKHIVTNLECHIKQVFELPQIPKIEEIFVDGREENDDDDEIDPEIVAIQEYIQKEIALIEQGYTKFNIISDSDDIGKLITIFEAFKDINNFEIDYLLLGKKKLPEHLVIRNQSKSFFIGFLQIDGGAFTSRIKNCNELIINNKDIRFLIYRDCRNPEIKGNVGKQEIEKLNHTPNGSFMIMDKDERINFELIYKLITDIHNKDEEFELEKAFQVLMSELKDYWLIKVFQFEKI